MSINLINTLAIFLTVTRVRGQMSTVASLGDNLQGIMDTLYDRGYQPYLQEEISDNEKADGEYLEFPDFNSSRESPGALNHPSWLNYQKEVFFPPESEYKNIIAHKNDKAHQKLAPLREPHDTLVNKHANPIDPSELRAELMVQLTENEKCNSNSTSKNSSNSLDFLLPIPDSSKKSSDSSSTMKSNQAINIATEATLAEMQVDVNLSSSSNNNYIEPLNETHRTKLINVQSSQKPVRADVKKEIITGTKNNNVIYEIQVADRKNDQTKQEKKKKFSLLRLFHKKRNQNVTSASKEGKGETATESMKDKPKSLAELYEQLQSGTNEIKKYNLEEKGIGTYNVEDEILSEINYPKDYNNVDQDLQKYLFNEEDLEIPYIKMFNK